MFTNEEIKSMFDILNIKEEIFNVTLKDVNQAFRKIVKVTHPDKVGPETTEECQTIIEAYKKLKAYFKITADSDKDVTEVDDEEIFFRENFEKFNFPFANKGSFTVSIEDYLANTWQDCMAKILGDPKVIVNSNGTECDRIWKVSYGTDEKVEITIHLYNNPKNKSGSKLLLQAGKQSLLCSYVFEELPKIYKEVSENKPKVLEEPKIKKHAKPVVKCDQCKFKSSLLQMKMHVRNVHTRKPTKVSKRLQNFTPVIKSPKKVKTDVNRSVLSPIMGIEPLVTSLSVKKELFDNTVNIEELHEVQTLPEDISLMNISRGVIDDVFIDASPENSAENVMNEDTNFLCTACGQTFSEELLLDEHVVEHEKKQNLVEEMSLAETVIICGDCAKGFANLNEVENHMSTHLTDKRFTCTFCDSKFETELQCESHMENQHKDQRNSCLKSDFSSKSTNQLKTHTRNQHHANIEKENESFHNLSTSHKQTQDHQQDQKTICDQCGLTFNSVNDLIKHLLSTHKKHPEMIQCQHCDYTALTLQNYNNHLEIDHVEYSILGDIMRSQKEQTKSFEVFKMELKDILNTIIDAHNEVKQELFIARQDNRVYKQKLENIENDIDILNKKLEKSPFPCPLRSSSPTPPTTEIVFSSTQKPRVPEPQILNKHPAQSKILMIGDSIINHANLDKITEVTKSKIYTAKAYTAVYDDKVNVVKTPAYFPQKNFVDTVPNEVGKQNFEYMIVQAGSIDISNLKTNVEETNEYLEYYKQETVMSAKNIFHSCLLALDRQPSLKKVIIMKQTPRYDPADIDPLSVKPALSQLFNNTLMELWMSSRMKDKIFVGSHNIDCAGAIQSARYRHTMTGRFDGVHLYGSSGNKAYTNSVLNILRSAAIISAEDDHKSCPQYRFQNRNNICQGN